MADEVNSKIEIDLKELKATLETNNAKKSLADDKSSVSQEAGKLNKASAVGRRKDAIARVIITPGAGKWNINGLDLAKYFSNKVHQQNIITPLKLVSNLGSYDITVNVKGGGLSGQAGAIRLGIARSLNEADKDYNRPILKSAGLLTRDARVVERKKAGLKKARKASQFSKR
ncbi:MAG: 30S ribosomal protein S9 [Bifidobacteriaceae bacterium]|jgi:small subunit ribosomal protein S9|nr:30S ribosomal protein S9 [Bifidobacteriaceae bacterium]